MEPYFCKIVSHENQPISFAVQSNGKWEFCCGLCQFRSTLGKSQFVPIDDLENLFKEIKKKLIESNIAGILQEQLNNLKDWQSQIENIISSIKDELTKQLELYQHYMLLSDENQCYFIQQQNQFNDFMEFQAKGDQKISKTQKSLYDLEEFFAKQINILKNHPLSHNQESEIQKKNPISIIENKKSEMEESNKNSQIKEKNEIQVNKKEVPLVTKEIEPPKVNTPFENQTPQQLTNQPVQIKYTTQTGILKEGNYDGNLSNGVPHGLGIMKFHNNQIYNGNWKLGKFDGKGTLIISEDETYEGDFLNGQKHGKGKLTIKKGKNTITFEGLFQYDKKKGPGKEIQIETSGFDQDEPIDLSTSIFKQVLKQNDSVEKKVIFEGNYENNQKQAVFLKSVYENNQLKSQNYCWYENDEYQFLVE